VSPPTVQYESLTVFVLDQPRQHAALLAGESFQKSAFRTPRREFLRSQLHQRNEHIALLVTAVRHASD